MTEREARAALQERAGNHCEDCGAEALAGQRRLNMHHVNQDHGDNRMENLRLLCSRCHGRQHGRPPKPPGEKYRSYQLKAPPWMWEALDAAVPAGQRTAFLREVWSAALRRLRKTREKDGAE